MRNFEKWFSTLKPSTVNLNYYVDYKKILESILNDIDFYKSLSNESFQDLKQFINDKKFNDFIFNILAISKDSKEIKTIDKTYSKKNLDYESVKKIVKETNFEYLLKNQDVDFLSLILGIKVGLDTNGRKNRAGSIMVKKVEALFQKLNLDFQTEKNKAALITLFPNHKQDIELVFESKLQNKRFDFVFEKNNILYLGEINAFNGGGSKLNAIAREYIDLSKKINKTQSLKFMWITDGQGWKTSKKDLEEAFNQIPLLFNLNDLEQEYIIEELK